MDYATLVAPKTTLGSIASWVNYSDAKLPVASILSEAQQFIFQRLRVNEMKEIQTLALTAGAASVAIPSRLLSVLNLQDQHMVRLRPRDIKSLIDRRSYDDNGAVIQADAPLFYSKTGTTLEFDMAPDANINLTLTGFFSPYLLGDGTGGTVTTNFLTSKYPTLLRYACLMFVADYLNDDEKYQRYTKNYQAAETTAMEATDMDLMGMQVDMDYSESRIW